MLLQVDGSPHDWLEGRGSKITLIASIDDATGKVPFALFREEEDAQGYFLLLREIVRRKGIPLAIYHDRHGIFKRSSVEGPETLEAQLLGEEPTTQFGRLLEELAIESIAARSPQAKGRVERLFGTFQDRLVSELRLAKAKTLEEANWVLRAFLPRFNRKFAVVAAEEGLAYRPVPTDFIGEEVFCFKYYRTVGADNVVALGAQRIQIHPCNGRQNYHRARVEIQERMDGSLAVYYQGKCLATKPAPVEAPVLRVQERGRPPSQESLLKPSVPLPQKKEPTLKTKQIRPKPGPDHPWRKAFKNNFTQKKYPPTDIFKEQLT
jgi:hypothetical protein